MKKLLSVKTVLQAFYEKYSRYLDALFRFIFALITYLTVIYATGYNTRISSPYVAVLLSLIAAFLPRAAISVIAAFLIILEFASVSMEVAAVAGILFLLMLLVYFVFRPGDSWLLSLTLVICLFGITPALLPIGLFINPAEVVVVIFGIFIYGLIAVVKKDFSVLSSSSGSLSLGGRINLLLNDLITNNRFILIVVTVAVALLFIAVIRHSRINYAGMFAAVAGGFLFLVAFLLGSYFLNVTINYRFLVLGFLLDALISFFVLEFVINMDYRRTENVQFEDEEYYYFVRAVPKSMIAAAEKQEENITEGTGDFRDHGAINESLLNKKGVFVHHPEEDAADKREE